MQEFLPSSQDQIGPVPFTLQPQFPAQNQKGLTGLLLSQGQSDQLAVARDFFIPTAGAGAHSGGSQDEEGFKAIAIGLLQIGEVQWYNIDAK